MRYRPDKGDLLVMAGVGWKPGFVGKARFPADVASPPGRCIQTGQPVVVEDLPGNPEFRRSKPLAEHGIVAVANVPIIFDGKTWGVLEIDSDRAGQFNESDLDFLQAISHLLAGAMQRSEAVALAQSVAAEVAGKAARIGMLLKELQHRAKNNLQLVISMLGRESRAFKDESLHVAERFRRVMERVSAVAIAHDRLSGGEQSDDPSTATDLAGYLRALCSSLELSLGDRLVIEADLEKCSLSFDRAVAVGLVVNELVTNAAKYAYPEGHQGGVVRVELRTDHLRAEAILTVSDEGRGLPFGDVALRPNRPGGQGLSLIHLLTRQLGGEIIQAAPERGTRTSVQFPLVV
jgi:two-component sensor histidine kinase